MPKYYCELLDLPNRRMIVPVKALLNPYDERPAYCAGMPQFFGGTDDGDQPPPVVLDHEISQESRRTLELTTAFPTHFFTQGNMFFYWVPQGGWRRTGTAWGPPRRREEAEMDRLVQVDLRPFRANWSDDQIIAQLVQQCGSTNAPAQGRADFAESATRPAFIRLIRLFLAGDLSRPAAPGRRGQSGTK